MNMFVRIIITYLIREFIFNKPTLAPFPQKSYLTSGTWVVAYSYVHARAATSLNEHLGGRCGVGVVVIKYGTKNDFLYSKQLSGVFQHRLRSPRTYSEGWSISRGRSDSYHLNGSAEAAS